MPLQAYTTTLDGTCGVGVFYDYRQATRHHLDTYEAGAGWYVAGFVDTPVCHEMYNHLCETLTLIYQSPVRLNLNSGNDFFFCIFDAGENSSNPLNDDESF